ncbi:hypothetical protein ACFL43_04065 [Thermodesulfobacteriota bacterium]
MIKIQDEQDNQIIEYYKENIGKFVTIKKKDGFICSGILKDITSENHLYIKGKYKNSLFHYHEIKDFSARDNRIIIDKGANNG